jgi:hypothetical protein
MADRRETDHEQLANELDRQADDLEERTEGLEEKVIEVRREWEQKRSDPSVPGAAPDDRPREEDEAESPGPEAPPEAPEPPEGTP